MTHRTALLSLLAAPALALSACGGDDAGGDEGTIRSIVEDSSKNPAKVCDNLAPEPLKTIGGKDACIKLSKDQKGRDADIDSVSITGDKATVKVKGEDGKAGTLNFQKINGVWKLTLS